MSRGLDNRNRRCVRREEETVAATTLPEQTTDRMNEKTLPRGIRNCNPGNIRRSAVRYRGEVRPSRDGAFKQFETMAWGYRAVFVLLHTYRVRHGLRSIRQMIARWAPPSENRTEAYVRAVSRMTGIDPDTALDTLDAATMIPVASAISRVENGVAALAGEVREGWRLFAEQ